MTLATSVFIGQSTGSPLSLYGPAFPFHATPRCIVALLSSPCPCQASYWRCDQGFMCHRSHPGELLLPPWHQHSRTTDHSSNRTRLQTLRWFPPRGHVSPSGEASTSKSRFVRRLHRFASGRPFSVTVPYQRGSSTIQFVDEMRGRILPPHLAPAHTRRQVCSVFRVCHPSWIRAPPLPSGCRLAPVWAIT